MSFDSAGKFFISDEDIKAIIGSLIVLLVILLIVLVVLRCKNATKRIIHNSIKHSKPQDIIVDSSNPNVHENLIVFTRLDSKECARQVDGAFLDAKVNELKMTVLYGPPGVGKTHAIEAKLPSKKNYTVVSVDASKLAEPNSCEKITVMCRGESALTAQKAKERLSFIFDYAKKIVIKSNYTEKVVIVFDEIIQECRNNVSLSRGLQQFLIHDVGSNTANNFSNNITLICIGNESLASIIHSALPTGSDENESIESRLRSICSLRPSSQPQPFVYLNALNRRMKEYEIPKQMSYDVVIYNIVFAAVSRSKWQSIKIGDHNIDLVDIRQQFDSYRELIDKASNDKIVIASGTKNYTRINSKADEIISLVIDRVRDLPDDTIQKGFDDFVEGLAYDKDNTSMFTEHLRLLLISNQVYKENSSNITDIIVTLFDDHDQEDVKNYIHNYKAIDESLNIITSGCSILENIDQTIFDTSSTLHDKRRENICAKIRFAIDQLAVTKVRACDVEEVKAKSPVVVFDGIAELIHCNNKEPRLQQFQNLVKSIPILPRKVFTGLSAQNAVTNPALNINDTLLDFVIQRDDGNIITDDGTKSYLGIIRSAKNELMSGVSSNLTKQISELSSILDSKCDKTIHDQLKALSDELKCVSMELQRANKDQGQMSSAKELAEKLRESEQKLLRDACSLAIKDGEVEDVEQLIKKISISKKLNLLLNTKNDDERIQNIHKAIKDIEGCVFSIDKHEKAFDVEGKIKKLNEYSTRHTELLKKVNVEDVSYVNTRVVNRDKFIATLDIFCKAKKLLKEYHEEMFTKIKKQILKSSIFTTTEDSVNVLFMKSVVGHAAKSPALQSEQVVDISQISTTGINVLNQLSSSRQIVDEEKEPYERIMSDTNNLENTIDKIKSDKKTQTFMKKKVLIPTNIKVDSAQIEEAFRVASYRC